MNKIPNDIYEFTVHLLGDREVRFFYPVCEPDGKKIKMNAQKDHLIMNMPAECNGYTEITHKKISIEPFAPSVYMVKEN